MLAMFFYKAYSWRIGAKTAKFSQEKFRIHKEKCEKAPDEDLMYKYV